jgi:polyisoprenoid-binding protein YceI
MGKYGWVVLLAGGLAVGGCATRMADRRAASPWPSSVPAAGAAAGQAAPGAASVIPLSAENTRVTFVGTAGPVSHEGEFGRLSGEWALAGDDPKESRLSVRVETGSVATRIGLLTTHLKRKDFLDVEQFPTATFVSSRVEPAAGPGGATHRVTGDFTLHGVTRPVTFPARVVVTADAATLDGTFTVSQTAFGMAASAEKTKDEVPVTVSVRTARRGPGPSGAARTAGAGGAPPGAAPRFE